MTRKRQQPLMLRVVLDGKCAAEDVRAIVAAIERLRDVKNVEQDNHIDDTSIEQLGLTTRSLNALVRAEIFAVKDLTRRSRYELCRLKNLGKRSLQEIEARLAAVGAQLRPQTSAEFAAECRRQQASIEQQQASLEQQRPPLNEIRRTLRRLWNSLSKRGYVNQDLSDWHDIDHALSRAQGSST